MQYLWALFDFLSYLTLLNFVTVNTPGTFTNIITMVYNFAQADWLPAEIIFSYTFTFNADPDTGTDFTYTDQFNTMGLGSMNLITNMGSGFIWYNLDFAFLLIVTINSVLGRIMPR